MTELRRTEADVPRSLRPSLFLLRISVFLVMFMWTMDKFVNPDHAAAVFAHFYGLSGLSSDVFLIISAIELLVALAFVLGVLNTWTYGAIMVLHAISTLASFRQYLSPWESVNLLFFAAWPMLAACVTLFLLRRYDTFLSLGRSELAG